MKAIAPFLVYVNFAAMCYILWRLLKKPLGDGLAKQAAQVKRTTELARDAVQTAEKDRELAARQRETSRKRAKEIRAGADDLARARAAEIAQEREREIQWVAADARRRAASLERMSRSRLIRDEAAAAAESARLYLATKMDDAQRRALLEGAIRAIEGMAPGGRP